MSYSALSKMGDKVEFLELTAGPAMLDEGVIDTTVNAMARWIWTTYTTDFDQVELRNKYIQKLKDDLERFQAVSAHYKTLHRDPEVAKMTLPIEQQAPQMVALFKEIATLLGKHESESNEEARKILVTKLRPVLEVIGHAIHQVDEYRHADMKRTAAETKAYVAQEELTAIVMAVVCVVALFVI